MCGETVVQRMWVDDFLEGSSLGGSFAGMVDRLGSDGEEDFLCFFVSLNFADKNSKRGDDEVSELC
jgi:hypothetical protein